VGRASADWPPLPLEPWRSTCDTLHLWTQIIGKIRLSRAPRTNHWWDTALYVTPRGLATSAMPFDGRSLEVTFDFRRHELHFESSDGRDGQFALQRFTVAEFYDHVLDMLESLGFESRIWPVPVELQQAIPFREDRVHRSYEHEPVERFHQALIQADRLLKQFRSRFLGKSSPVHFFWGSFDLALSRFCGRAAPPHPGGIPHLADWVTREAYSHEVISCGWWPGNDALPEPAFYTYAYPEPAGLARAPAEPAAAYYHAQLREFILPYEAVRHTDDPDAAVLAFLQSTYERASVLAGWDRASLERTATVG
jgi:hypothetical protein